MIYLTGPSITSVLLSVVQLTSCTAAEESFNSYYKKYQRCINHVFFPRFLSSDILKKFNPSLKGFSKDQFIKQKGFNMAVAGAKTS